MQISVKTITTPLKPTRLADATVELSDGSGHSVEISDIRILRNQKTGELWIAPPTHSIAHPQKKWDYAKTCEFSRALFRDIESAVLDAYAAWQQGGGR